MVLRYTYNNTLTGSGRESFENNRNEALSGNGVYAGLTTTESGAPDWNANVAAGFWRAGETISYKSSATVLAITNASGLTAGQTRYDLITADNSDTLAVVEGTPALTALAKVPDLPADKVGVAVVTVAYGQSAVETANILDSRVVFQGGRPVLLVDTDTEASTAANNTDIQSVTVTNAMAKYPYLLVEAFGDWTCSVAVGTSVSDVVFYNGASARGNPVKVGETNNAGADAQFGAWAKKFKFVAGTDYTRGTGFTLTTRTANLAGTITIYSSRLEVNGLTA